MKFGFLTVKISCAVVFLFANGAGAEITAQQTEPTPTPAVNQTSAQLAAEKEGKTESANKETEKNESSVQAEELIHLGDVIDVDVLGSLEYDWRGRLNAEGFLSDVPYLKEPIFALCRNETEIAANLTEAFSKFLRKPEIVVRVVDRAARQQARILGAVRTPLRLQIERPVRLNEVLILSGGIGERASGEIKIFRPAYLGCNSLHEFAAAPETITVKISDLLTGKAAANPFIRTGDVVTVEEAGRVYVIGGVAAPQAIFLRDNQKMTLTRAVASAGGAIKNSARVTIFRRSTDGSVTTIEADLEKIRKSQTEDPLLEAFDVIEVSGVARSEKNKLPDIARFELESEVQTNLPLRIIN